jgi:hypothetical protein
MRDLKLEVYGREQEDGEHNFSINLRGRPFRPFYSALLNFLGEKFEVTFKERGRQGKRKGSVETLWVAVAKKAPEKGHEPLYNKGKEGGSDGSNASDEELAG